MKERFRRAFEPQFIRTVCRTAMPIAMQFFISSAVNLIDVVMIGVLGEDAVAAAGGANQIFFLLTLVLFGINSGASVFLSQFWGTQDLKNVRRTMGMMYLLGAVVTLVFTLGALLTPRTLVGFYVHEEAALALGGDYLFWVGISYPLTAVSLILSMVCRCTGELHLPTRATLLSIAINCAGNALLIYGLLGFPALGLTGAAIATSVARLAECAVLVITVYRKKLPGAARPREMFALDRDFVKKYIKTAWPVLLNETLWSVGTSMYSVAYGLLGTAALAAVQIANTAVQLLAVFMRHLHREQGGLRRRGGRAGLRSPLCPVSPGGGAHLRAGLHFGPPPHSQALSCVAGDAGLCQDAHHPPVPPAGAQGQQHGPHRGRVPSGRRHPVRLSGRHGDGVAGGRAPGLFGGVAGDAAVGRLPHERL